MKQSKNIAALYCRLAQADAFRMENQTHAVKNFAIQAGFENHRLYEDNGYSGLSAERPSFQKLITEIREHRVNVVIAESVCRFFRSPQLICQFFRICKEKDVSVYTIADGLYRDNECSQNDDGIFRNLQKIKNWRNGE